MSILSESPPVSQETGGWFRIRNDALNHIATVGPLAFAVYVVLVRHADERGECWPSVPRIANICGCTDRSVQTALRSLATAGMIRIIPRVDPKGQSSNLYAIPPIDPVKSASPGEASFTPPVKSASPAPVKQASPRRKTQYEPDSLEGKRESAAVAAVPAGLQDFVDCWNANAPDGKRVKTITKALRIGWARTKDPELQEAFSDLAALGTAIRNASWAREQNWFTAESLFAKDSNKLSWKVRKLLNGEYSGGNKNGQAKQRVVPSPGCRNDTGASITANF